MVSAHSKFQSTSVVTPIRSIHCNFDAKLGLGESRHNCSIFFFFFFSKEWWFGELSTSFLLSFWSACTGWCLTEHFKYIFFHHIFIMKPSASNKRFYYSEKLYLKGLKHLRLVSVQSWEGGRYSGPRTLETITPSYWPHGLMFLLRLKFILKTLL